MVTIHKANKVFIQGATLRASTHLTAATYETVLNHVCLCPKALLQIRNVKHANSYISIILCNGTNLIAIIMRYKQL